MKNKATILFLSLFAGVFVLLMILSTYSNNTEIKKQRKERSELNLLQAIIDSTGNKHPIINESLKGKTIVINVWATWCQPCIREIPELNELVEAYQSEEIVFIALDEREETKEKEIMKKRDIVFDYELHFDQQKLIDLLYSFKLNSERKAIPLHLVIDKSGKAAFYFMGNHPDKIKEMEEYLESLNQLKVKLL